MKTSCGKRLYPNRVEAMLALAGARMHRVGHRRERRFYFCKGCGGYHLTSQEPKRKLKVICCEAFE